MKSRELFWSGETTIAPSFTLQPSHWGAGLVQLQCEPPRKCCARILRSSTWGSAAFELWSFAAGIKSIRLSFLGRTRSWWMEGRRDEARRVWVACSWTEWQINASLYLRLDTGYWIFDGKGVAQANIASTTVLTCTLRIGLDWAQGPLPSVKCLHDQDNEIDV